ncbi:hypothetical protein B0H11DRAFT_1902151 [Mycena galericulata]|nr:hypothetical protein B0H11DRAFT_1902151 [Mycena galericulata]
MPSLPYELECEIFELAVRLNPQNASLKLNLSLVARRVSCWVDLVFYEYVSITSKLNAKKFLKLIRSKPPGFFATTVKALCLVYTVTAALAFEILSECTGVRCLACWVDQRRLPEFTLLVNPLPLDRLSIDFGHFLALPTLSTCLSTLTHIHISFWHPLTTSDISQLAEGISRLPRLTHVALALDSDYRTDPRAVERVTSSCPSVQIFVIASDKDADYQKLAKDYSFDARIVVPSHFLNPRLDWEAANFGQENMWTYAERVIAQRKASVPPATKRQGDSFSIPLVSILIASQTPSKRQTSVRVHCFQTDHVRDGRLDLLLSRHVQPADSHLADRPTSTPESYLEAANFGEGNRTPRALQRLGRHRRLEQRPDKASARRQ